MKQNLLWLAVVSTVLGSSVSASEGLLLLTPENADEYGYWVRCVVKDKKANSGPDATQRGGVGPALVIFRLGLVAHGRLHNRQFAVNRKDLQVIKSISLVVKDGETVLLSVPLRTEVDAGNYIHLLAEFSAQRKTVSKIQVVFDEHRETGKRTIAIDLEAFAAKA